VFARITTYELEDGRASESIDVFEPAIDHIRALDGLVDAFFLVERDGRRAVTMTLWESLDTMERSRVAASSARTEVASAAGAEVTSTVELEVAIRVGGARAETAAVAGTPSA
jgi:heme-degrading monooxygenase HmoA